MDLSLEYRTTSTGSMNPGEGASPELKELSYCELEGHRAVFAPSSSGEHSQGDAAEQERGDAPNPLLSTHSQYPALAGQTGSAGGTESEQKMLQQPPHSCCPLTLLVQLYPLPGLQAWLQSG